MALEALERENELRNPLDRVERIAEAYNWAVSRTDAREVTMEVSGGWSDMTISLNWRDEFEILHVAVSLEMKVPSTWTAAWFFATTCCSAAMPRPMTPSARR